MKKRDRQKAALMLVLAVVIFGNVVDDDSPRRDELAAGPRQGGCLLDEYDVSARSAGWRIEPWAYR